MLKQILKTYGRHRADELIAALLIIPTAELVGGLVKLFTAGEIRFTTKRQTRKARDLCSAFYRYHEKNAPVADWFLNAARALQREEHRTLYGIGALTERIRWNIRMGIIKTDSFKISNDLRACYARLVVMRDPTLCGIFVIKPSIGDALLMVDGRSWSAFAKQHHAELWPEKKTDQQPKPSMFAGIEDSKAARHGS